VAISYNDILFYLPIGRDVAFLNTKMKIMPDKPEMGTVLEYVEVKGHVFLLITAVMYLLLLISARMRKK